MPMDRAGGPSARRPGPTHGDPMSTSRIILTALFVVFIGAPSLLDRFGGWLDAQRPGASDAAVATLEGRDRAKQAPRPTSPQARTAQRCKALVETPGCSEPGSFESLEACLTSLRAAACDEYTGVNLCRTVEDIELCRVPRNAAVRRGCRSLREAADCANRPAPDRPAHDWTVAGPR